MHAVIAKKVSVGFKHVNKKHFDRRSRKRKFISSNSLKRQISFFSKYSKISKISFFSKSRKRKISFCSTSRFSKKRKFFSKKRKFVSKKRKFVSKKRKFFIINVPQHYKVWRRRSWNTLNKKYGYSRSHLVIVRPFKSVLKKYTKHKFYERCIIAINKVAYEGNSAFKRKIKKNDIRDRNSLETYAIATSAYNKHIGVERRVLKRVFGYRCRAHKRAVTTYNKHRYSAGLYKYGLFFLKNRVVHEPRKQLLRSYDKYSRSPFLKSSKRSVRSLRSLRRLASDWRKSKQHTRMTRYFDSTLPMLYHPVYTQGSKYSDVRKRIARMGLGVRFFSHNTHQKIIDLLRTTQSSQRTCAVRSRRIALPQKHAYSCFLWKLRRLLQVHSLGFLHKGKWTVTQQKQLFVKNLVLLSNMRVLLRKSLLPRAFAPMMRFLRSTIHKSVLHNASFWQAGVQFIKKKYKLRNTLLYFSRARRRYQHKWYHL